MTGGLLQLVSYGSQDLLLTYDPEFTFFKLIYNRHTNFSKFTNNIKLKSNPKFGGITHSIIPKNGDLLDNIFIKLDIPKLEVSYERELYEQLKETVKDLNLISYQQYKNINYNLLGLFRFLKNTKYYRAILSDRLYLFDESLIYSITNLNTVNKDYYLSLSKIYENIFIYHELDDPIFVNLNYADNQTYNQNILQLSFDLNDLQLFNYIFSNLFYNNNYFFINNFLCNKRLLNDYNLNSPNYFLNNLYLDLYDKIIKNNSKNYYNELKVYNYFNTQSFTRGDILDFDYQNLGTELVMIEFLNNSILGVDIDVLFSLSTSDYDGNKINSIIIKQDLIEDTGTSKIYTYLIFSISNNINTVVLLSDYLNFGTWTGNSYTVNSINEEDSIYTINLNTVVDIAVNDILFGFDAPAVARSPLFYFKVIKISGNNIFCKINNLEVINGSIYLSNGLQNVDYHNITNINSDIWNNYLFIENRSSNHLDGLSNSDYKTTILDISNKLLFDENELLKNVINFYFTNDNYLGIFFNINLSAASNVSNKTRFGIVDNITFTEFENTFYYDRFKNNIYLSSENSSYYENKNIKFLDTIKEKEELMKSNSINSYKSGIVKTIDTTEFYKGLYHIGYTFILRRDRPTIKFVVSGDKYYDYTIADTSSNTISISQYLVIYKTNDKSTAIIGSLQSIKIENNIPSAGKTTITCILVDNIDYSGTIAINDYLFLVTSNPLERLGVQIESVESTYFNTTAVLDEFNDHFTGSGDSLNLSYIGYKYLNIYYLYYIKDLYTEIKSTANTAFNVEITNKLIFIANKIFFTNTNKTEYSKNLTSLTKQFALMFYIDYTKIYYSQTILNELCTNLINISGLKEYIVDKTINNIKYVNGGATGTEVDVNTLTNDQIIALSKTYLIERLKNSSDMILVMVNAMDNVILEYINFADSILEKSYNIGFSLYKYFKTSNIFKSSDIDTKIKEKVVMENETISYDRTAFLNIIGTKSTIGLEKNYNDEFTYYADNKELLQIIHFDFKSNIFENPDTVITNIDNSITSSGITFSDATLLTNSKNLIFSAFEKNQTLYNLILSYTNNPNYEYQKFAYRLNFLASLLQIKVNFNNYSYHLNANKYLNTINLADGNNFLNSQGIESYSKIQNIFVPNSFKDEFETRIKFIESLSNIEKNNEKEFYDNQSTVNKLIYAYYTTVTDDNFKSIKTLETSINNSLTIAAASYKLKNGCIVSNDEYTNLNYNYLYLVVKEIDSYGNIEKILTPFNTSEIWITDLASPITYSQTDDGNSFILNTNGLPNPLTFGTFPGVNNTNSVNAQVINYTIPLRLGISTTNKSSLTNDLRVGISTNGVILKKPNISSVIVTLGNPLVDAPAGFTWNIVKFINNYLEDDTRDGFPSTTNEYNYYTGKFVNALTTVSNTYYDKSNFAGDKSRHADGHSKIIGIMFDGYPIYGPYGYSDYSDSSSNVILMTSSYKIKNILSVNRPPISTYAEGSFIEDYEYINNLGSLDEHNGRFCFTPEFPNGTYAYFVTVDTLGVPVYPYILGDTFKEKPAIVANDINSFNNYNVRPVSSTLTYAINENVYLSGGNGILAKGSYKTDINGYVYIEISEKGINYKENDILVAIKEDIPSKLEFIDYHKFLLGRKSYFKEGYYYDYVTNQFKLLEIGSNDITRLNNIGLEINNNLNNNTVVDATINDILNENVSFLVPTNEYVRQYSTLLPDIINIFNNLSKYNYKINVSEFTYYNFIDDTIKIMSEQINNSVKYYFDTNIIFINQINNSDLNLKYTENHTNSELEEIYNNINTYLENFKTKYDKLESIIWTRDSKPSYCWIKKLGNFIFENIELYFNDLLIDKQYSIWIDIWYELNTTNSNFTNKERLIGYYEDLTTFDSNIKESKTLYIPLQFWFCRYDGMNVPLIALPYTEIKIKFKLNSLDKLVKKSPNTKIVSNMNLNMELLVNYIYLDEQERKLFAESRHEYLIEQIQFNGVKDILNFESNIDLCFINSIKDIFWVIDFRKDILVRDSCNYSLSDDDYIDGGNPIISSSLTFNNVKRFNNYIGDYTNYIIPMEKYLSTPSDGINVISFSEDSKSFQPSGSCNFSLLDNKKLFLKINENVSLKDLKILIYARSYNILRIMSGLAGIAFLE